MESRQPVAVPRMRERPWEVCTFSWHEAPPVRALALDLSPCVHRCDDDRCRVWVCQQCIKQTAISAPGPACSSLSWPGADWRSAWRCAYGPAGCPGLVIWPASCCSPDHGKLARNAWSGGVSGAPAIGKLFFLPALQHLAPPLVAGLCGLPPCGWPPIPLGDRKSRH